MHQGRHDHVIEQSRCSSVCTHDSHSRGFSEISEEKNEKSVALVQSNISVAGFQS